MPRGVACAEPLTLSQQRPLKSHEQRLSQATSFRRVREGSLPMRSNQNHLHALHIQFVWP